MFVSLTVSTDLQTDYAKAMTFLFTAQGHCACFGDPHCITWDSRWLHFQGFCHYTMARDNCDDLNAKPNFEVIIQDWSKGYPIHASWVKSVVFKYKDVVGTSV